jgi:hypothetical protein
VRAALALASIAAWLSACTAVHDYDGSPEVCRGGVDDDIDGLVDCADPDCAADCDERARCDDGIDDDQDALVDCSDPDCDGTAGCHEAGVFCSDGRDNDRDARIDARDAECWPISRVTTDRCASILGGAITLGPTDFEGGFIEHDPLTTGAGDLLAVLPSTSSTAPVPTVVATRAATGAIDGTRASATFWLDGDVRSPVDPAVVLTLSVATGARHSPRTIDMAVGQGFCLLTGSVVTSGRTAPGIAVGRGARVHLTITIEIEGRAVHAAYSVNGGAPQAFEGTLTDDWVEGPSIVVGASSAHGRGVWLESASIERERLERCDVVQPPLGVVTIDGLERIGTAIHAVTRGPGPSLCALAAFRVRTAEHQIVAIHSEDDGATWARGDPFALGSSFTASAGRWHALAWDPVLMRYFAVSLVGPLLVSQSSADCITWEDESLAAMDVTNGGAVSLLLASAPSYAIGLGGHEVRLLVGLESGDFGLVPMRSPWGDPGTWTIGEPDADTGATMPWSAGPPVEQLRMAVREEDHGARVRIADGGASFRVRTTEGWIDVPALAAHPSGEPGAFDATIVLGPATLIEDVDPPAPDVWSGRLFYDGASDFEGDEGWGWSRVRIEPGGAP